MHWVMGKQVVRLHHLWQVASMGISELETRANLKKVESSILLPAVKKIYAMREYYYI